MSWAGSTQQSALILNAGYDVSNNTLLKDFLSLKVAWLRSLLFQVGWSRVLPVRLE